eukprot:185342_1
MSREDLPIQAIRDAVEAAYRPTIRPDFETGPALNLFIAIPVADQIDLVKHLLDCDTAAFELSKSMLIIFNRWQSRDTVKFPGFEKFGAMKATHGKQHLLDIAILQEINEVKLATGRLEHLMALLHNGQYEDFDSLAKKVKDVAKALVGRMKRNNNFVATVRREIEFNTFFKYWYENIYPTSWGKSIEYDAKPWLSNSKPKRRR